LIDFMMRSKFFSFIVFAKNVLADIYQIIRHLLTIHILAENDLPVK
jgi:hypothetical protein